MIDLHYAYEGNEECHACMFNKTVLDEDCTPYHICFIPHNKTTEDKCSYFTIHQQAEPKEVIPNEGLS